MSAATLRRCALLAAGLALAACGLAERPGQPPRDARVGVPEPSPPPLAYTVASALAREVGPRLAGSPNDARAVAWATHTLTSLGFAGVRAEPVRVPVWRRLREHAELRTRGVAVPLAVTALGWSVATGPEPGVTGAVTAEVVELPSAEAVTQAPAGSLRGKIVFCNGRTARTRDGSGYGSAVGARARCPLEAEKQGARAALVRSIGTDASDDPHTGSMRVNGAKIPGAALSARAADLLHAALLEGPATVALTLATETLAEAASANVVAEIRGTRAPEEIVLVGAHLDSWDLGEGAVDDGAGVGLAIAAAHAFLRAPPERTLRVVLFAAEENSLAGARAYAETHAAELDRHVAALELDEGTGRVFELRARAAGAVILPSLAGVPGLADVLSSPEPAEGGADLIPLRAAGVPVLDARQDMSDYFDVHHTRSDTADKLRAPDLGQATAAVVELLRFASARTTKLGRIPEAARAR